MIETQNHFLAQSREDMQSLEKEMNQLSKNIIRLPDDHGRGSAVFWSVLYLLSWFITMPLFISHGPMVFIGYMIIYGLLAVCLLAGDSYDFRYWRIKRIVEQYKMEKLRITYIYSSVISDMNIDFKDATITPQRIIDIEAGISHFSHEIKALYQAYRNIIFTENEVRAIANPKILRPYKDFLTQEGLWLTECIASFSRDLDTWIARHHSELIKLKDSVNIQAGITNMSEGRAALGLTGERIAKLSEEIPIRVK